MADGVQAVLGKIIGGLLYPHKRYTLEDNALTSSQNCGSVYS